MSREDSEHWHKWNELDHRAHGEKEFKRRRDDPKEQELETCS